MGMKRGVGAPAEFTLRGGIVLEVNRVREQNLTWSVENEGRDVLGHMGGLKVFLARVTGD